MGQTRTQMHRRPIHLYICKRNLRNGMAGVLQERALYICKRALHIRMYMCKRNTCKRDLKHGMAGVLRTSFRTPVLNVRCSLLRGLRCQLEDRRGESNSSYNTRCSRYNAIVSHDKRRSCRSQSVSGRTVFCRGRTYASF